MINMGYQQMGLITLNFFNRNQINKIKLRKIKKSKKINKLILKYNKNYIIRLLLTETFKNKN